MAAMSVIGIDLGNESCYVAVAKAGGIETIANDYSLRATPACVAFSGKNRVLGVAAKNQQVTNMASTIYGFKRLLGRKFSDPQVKFDQKHLPYDIINKDGSIGIKVNYLEKEEIYSPEQCLAMLFTKLKDTSETALQTPVKDCVISVPSYFTVKERQALLDAAAIADLNVLSLLNETTATALAYGIYKQDLPLPEENARNVVFVDCGQSSLQVSACAFNKGKLKMLSTASDSNLGGRNIDFVLAEHFRKEFSTKYKIDASRNPRAFIRLLAEVEKLKKQMSANSTSLPLNIECFMDDKDVHGDMRRADMEAMCKDIFERVRYSLEECLRRSGLQKDEIHSVEIVGGSSRIPAIKNLIQEIFGYIPSTTLNQDEAVSRGCALQCAILSPAVRVKEFGVEDIVNYPIYIDITNTVGGNDVDKIPLFDFPSKFPLARKITVKRSEPFEIKAYYSSTIPYMDQEIGKWIIRDVKASPEGAPQQVMVTFAMNHNGILSVDRASIESMEFEPMDDDGTTKTSEEHLTEQPPAEANSTTSENGKDNKKRPTKKIYLKFDRTTAFGMIQNEVETCREKECAMVAVDKQEKERVDARNALEEYVYELRSKLSSQDELALYVPQSGREEFIKKLDQMENWLYAEGEDCERQIYKDNLSDLKTIGDPIERRRSEYETLPAVVDGFSKSIPIIRKTLDMIKNKDPKFAHISKDEVQQIDQLINYSLKYIDDCYGYLKKQQLYKDPEIVVADVQKEYMKFHEAVKPILNKPAPKPPKEAQGNDNQNCEPKQNPDQADPAQNNCSNANAEKPMECE